MSSQFESFGDEQRGEAVSVTHALLLSTTFVLIAAITAGGIGPIAAEQQELSATVVDDQFTEWENEIETITDGGVSKRTFLITPSGSVRVVSDRTTIEVENLDTGDTKTITTDVLKFQAESDNTARQVMYDGGLLTEQMSATTRPFVVSTPPQSTYSRSGTKYLLLHLYEYDVKQSVATGSEYQNRIKFNVYPNATKAQAVEHPIGENTEITVSGENADSWERFFSEAGAYEVTSTGGNSVTAQVTNTHFKLSTDYVGMNRTSV